MAKVVAVVARAEVRVRRAWGAWIFVAGRWKVEEKDERGLAMER